MIDFFFDLPDGVRTLILMAFGMLATFLISEFILKKIPRSHKYTVYDRDNKHNKVEITLDPKVSEEERERILAEAVATLNAKNAGAPPGS